MSSFKLQNSGFLKSREITIGGVSQNCPADALARHVAESDRLAPSSLRMARSASLQLVQPSSLMFNDIFGALLLANNPLAAAASKLETRGGPQHTHHPPWQSFLTWVVW